MSEASDRNNAVQGMVLLEIQKAGGTLLGAALMERVEEAGLRAKARAPDYGFIDWLGCTIWGLLESFLEAGWITVSRRPHWNEMYTLRRETIHLTESGARFIESVRAEAGKHLDYFA